MIIKTTFLHTFDTMQPKVVRFYKNTPLLIFFCNVIID